MFREKTKKSSPADSFPRVCGDVPEHKTPGQGLFLFSPRVRGCSDDPEWEDVPGSVFPACAGMFRCFRRHEPVACGFPRVCGDVPVRIR